MQDRADSLKRRINLAKALPLEQWTVADLCAWMEVGIGMGQYCRAVQATVPLTTIAPAKVLADLDERSLAAKVGAGMGSFLVGKSPVCTSLTG